MSELITRLQESIRPFQFGKLDLLTRMHELEVHVSKTSIDIGNWFDYRSENRHGDCGELVAKAYAKLTKEFPNLLIEVNWGYDNQLFNEFIGWHAFLTVRNGSSGACILADPGLQRVQFLDESGYSIEETEDIQSVKAKLASQLAPLNLSQDDGTFLGIDQKTGIFYYIGRNHQQGNKDVLVVITYRNTPPEMRAFMPVDKRVFPISPCPEEVRQQTPYFELAYQLEKFVTSRR